MAIPIDNKPRKRAEKLLTPKETGEYLGLPTATLDQWRSQKKGPHFYKLEGHLVRYAVTDLDEWLAKQKVSTNATQRGS